MGASEASIAGRVAPKMSVFADKNFFEVVTNSNQMSNVQALICFTFYRVATLPAPDAGAVGGATDPDRHIAGLAADSCVALAGSSRAEKCSKAA